MPVWALVIRSDRVRRACRHETALDDELTQEKPRAAVERPVERLPLLAQPECSRRTAEAIADSPHRGPEGYGPRNPVHLRKSENLLVRLFRPLVGLPLRLVSVDSQDLVDAAERVLGRQPEPELMVHRVVKRFVEEAVLERPPTDEDRRLRDDVLLPEVALVVPRHPQDVEEAARLAYERRVSVHDVHVRVGLEVIHDTLYRVVEQVCVVGVEPADDLSPAAVECLVQRLRLPSIRFADPVPGRKSCAQDVDAAVGRTTVHDDMLQMRIRLPRDGAERLNEPAALIERRGENRDERLLRSSPALRSGRRGHRAMVALSLANLWSATYWGMRTDAKTLNRHYSEFYADDSNSAWRELGAREKARSVELVVDRPVGRVIDIGCGEGSVIAALQGSLGAAGFSGFEVAPAAIEAARRRRYEAAVEFALFDGCRIPSDDQAFDVAILSHVLEHVADPRSLLHEAARVASRIVLEVPLELHLRTPRFRWDDTGHINVFNRHSIRYLVESCGLKIKRERIYCPGRDVHAFFGGRRGEMKWALKAAALHLGVRRSSPTTTPL